ncbi:2,4-dienoyl-CoA reductase-like NADH-dependent reductase (Old Yellow Enzyme family) [Edaphobacter aggregans]|uniref:2,4-dienoyl-CoA reductase-like NADH-dependent reductase (Old Yellow Enzyme family) n=1 Tax=Edaphobacter aggregans TaxID=570835 RepID=A0A3R9R2X7_9BACT|nr:alkene reductase [Edaphobacter aggregans]RSL16700.1 2,4-dienoyl-CoA reductase-like NADH-dependent reductase (Old Yellow Enzyme family) [Edaphobacter aggregans]
MANHPSLFDPIQVGDLHLPNRIFMAPLTRLRGTPDHIPKPIMVDYYTQRASAGLIISEGIPIDPLGVGYANVPGLWSQQQIEAWKPVTKAIHDKGGHIFAQIWHVGRISDPEFLGGQLPVAPSAIAATGTVSLLRPQRSFVTPRALETGEIKGVVEAFRRGAQNAQAAGFDGVELHGANGYLLDQFLQDGANHRTDEYGGSIENRARLMLEAADAAVSVFGPGRVGMHLAPRGDAHGISDSNPSATFSYVATELGKRKLAFIAAREHVGPDSIGPNLKQLFGGVFVANEAIDQKTGQQLLDEGKADAVAFGKLFIANPDLPARFAKQAPLNRPEPNTFYANGSHGYTDYTALAD